MDAGLSFIMANHAKVKKNDLIFDPFVGTGKKIPECIHSHPCIDFEESVHKRFLFCVSGSLLVACSQFGAYVCGSDIDYNTIHGKGRLSSNPWLCTNSSLIFRAISFFLFILKWDHKWQEWNLTAVKHNYNQNFLCVPGRSSRKNQKWRGPDENIRANLRQYGTEKMYLDVMVSDASKPVWKKGALFDAIITDRRFLVSVSTWHMLTTCTTCDKWGSTFLYDDKVSFIDSSIWNPWVHKAHRLPQRHY